MNILQESPTLGESISPERLNHLLGQGASLRLIDVRSAQEFAEAHVPGAVNVPMEELASRIEDIKGQTAIVICQSGKRAGLCHAQIASVTEAAVLEGGTSGWQASGLPVVGSRTKGLPLMRQVQIVAGVLILTGVILSQVVAPGWVWLAGFVGAGFTVAGLTGFRGMALILAKMPWNKQS